MIDLQQRLAKYETVTSVTSTSSALLRRPASTSARYKHASAATNGSSSTAAAAAVNSPHALHSSSSSSSTTGGSRSDVLASLNSRYSTYKCYSFPSCTAIALHKIVYWGFLVRYDRVHTSLLSDSAEQSADTRCVCTAVEHLCVSSHKTALSSTFYLHIRTRCGDEPDCLAPMLLRV
jgi:hypothetical protein